MDLDDDLVAGGSATQKGLKQCRKFAPKLGKAKIAKEELCEAKLETHDSITSKMEIDEDLYREFSNGSFKIEDNITKSLDLDDLHDQLFNVVDTMDLDVEETKLEEENEDMVVRSIDVFLNSSLDPETGLFIVQYPLRPTWRPYELDQRCEEVRIKEKTCEMEIEMDLSVNTDTNWDAEAATKMDFKKQVLTGKGWHDPHDGCFAVAVLMKNELYLNPIKSVVQLLPSLQHLNQEKGKAKAAARDREANIKLEDQVDQKSVKQQWIPLKYCGSKTDISAMYLTRMVSQRNSAINFNMNPNTYLSSVCSGTPAKNYRRALLSLELKDRIHRLLLKDPPIKRFSFFRRYASDATVEELLSALQDHGILVHGLWVLKTSNVQFSSPDDRKYGPLARDYVLLQFSNEVVVSSSHFDVGPPKFRAQVHIFLKSFATQRHSDWKFAEARDDSFIEQFPDIVETYKQKWAKAGAHIHENVSKMSTPLSIKDPVRRQPTVNHPVTSAKKIPVSDKSSRGQSKRTVTDDTREALLKALPKVLNHKVCSYQAICDELRGFAVAQSTLPKADPRMAVAAASAADAPSSELQEIISEVAVNIHGFYVLKSSPDHPDHDDLRNVVIDLFLKRGANAKLKKSEVIDAARNALQREIANSEYTKVMMDICASRGCAWTLKDC